ncbi:MAG: TolC family protein [Bacteroides sp.]|nr:TolC family protein [Bacteroides sp.]MCM1456231.1 TolC family protein [Lachnoclostridium sp.]
MNSSLQQISLSLAALAFMAFPSHAQERFDADDMPSRWAYTTDFDQTVPTDDAWWRSFGDAMLDSLIAIGIDRNYDIAMAARRIEIARQGVRRAQAAYYPSVTANAGWTRERSSGAVVSPEIDASTSSYFGLGIDMNWEIDLFGKITARTRQEKASFKASRAQYAAMTVSITSKIASAYMRLRTLQGEKAVLQEHISSQKRVVEITEARFEAGISSMLDVAQAKTTYLSTEASITTLNTDIATAINTIGVLTGMFPEQIHAMLDTPRELPDFHQIVAVGVPMELLRRRPDVVEAEYALAADAAALGIAKKDFLPTLSIAGSIGTQAHKAGDLFSDRSFTYSIAPTLSWTVFDGMARKAAVVSAREQMQVGIDNYNLTLLTAVQEVDNAMSQYVNSLHYIDLIEQVVEQAQKSFELSIDLYKKGLSSFINVSDAQIARLQYADELVSARGAALSALINLYQALGGGWSVEK